MRELSLKKPPVFNSIGMVYTHVCQHPVHPRNLPWGAVHRCTSGVKIQVSCYPAPQPVKTE
jgi:hypothetical protein